MKRFLSKKIIFYGIGKYIADIPLAKIALGYRRRQFSCFTLVACIFVLLIALYPLIEAQVSPQPTSEPAIKYTSTNLRDPFQSPFEMQGGAGAEETPLGELPNLVVQGLVWGTTNPQAIVNNTIVKVGDAIDGAEILDIRKEGVYLLYQGRQYILRPVISKPK